MTHSTSSTCASSTSGQALYHELSTNPAAEARTAALWSAAVFALFALVSGPRLDDDSYQHFAHSVEQVSKLDFALWLTDLWNKPLPGLAYGVSGLLGLAAARLLAAGLSAGTVYLTVRLCQQLVPESRWIALIMVSQLAFLKDAFVTMTEIPAAFALVSCLYLQLVAGRWRAAAIALGCVPLCRVEMLPTCAFIASWCAMQPRRLPHALAWLSLAALPCVLWFGAAALATGDLLWFRQDAYASLRAWGLTGVLRFNVLAGLPGVLSPPGVLLFLLGLFAAPRVLQRSHAWLLVGALLCHYATLNFLDVFPKGVEGVPKGHAVAAINARNYSCSAPLAALFMCLGIELRARRLLLWATAVAACAFVLARLASPGRLAFDLPVLALAVVAWLKVRTEQRWKVAAIGCMVAALLIRPFFWYPTRWNDQRALAIEALAQRARAQNPARIVQDVASALVFFGELRATDATWSWPNEFPDRLRSAPEPSWLVTEVDAAGTLLTRYPSELRACTPGSPLAAFDSPHVPSWLAAVDRLAGRNAPVHWRAYPVTHTCRLQLQRD